MTQNAPANDRVPPVHAFMQPCLEVLRAAREPMKNADIVETVGQHMNLGREIRDVPHGDGQTAMSEVAYRIAWARTYLKKAGLIDNPERGAWALTEAGRLAGAIDPVDITRQVKSGADAEVRSNELSDAVAEELSTIVTQLLEDGKHLERDALEAVYARFRERYGPERLERMRGEELLEFMHGRGNRDSLWYWLEFKNDEEMPAVFGSIAGGSALKYGLFQSAETGHWMTGRTTAQRRLSVPEAIRMAERQRDQFIAGAAVLDAVDPDAPDYAALEQRMLEVAPDVADSAWGHKYFALLHPRILDDYHNVDYQKYHLTRVHKVTAEGRYENARFFIAMARQLQVPVTYLTMAMNVRHGDPHRVWRVGTTDDSGKDSEWPRMKEGGFAAIGWDGVGDLSTIERNKAGKAHVRELVEKHHPHTASVVTRAANQLYAFAARVQQGDIIVAMQGQRVLGIGEATGDYYHELGDGPFPHRRPVNWRSVEEWKLPVNEGLLTTFVPLQRRSANLAEVYRRLDLAAVGGLPAAADGKKASPKSASSTSASTTPRRLGPLTGLIGRIHGALRRKGQVILYGPPGTGKTWWANEAMQEMAARSWFGRSHDDLSAEEKQRLESGGAVTRCTFHPAYGYEDFLVGYRPEVRDGQLVFAPRNGVFVRVCEAARRAPEKDHFLLVDEINRGDIPRIFGELLTVLELDKRDRRVELPNSPSGEPFTVPRNVFVIGTMNTADRSIALLDAALRRRFAFIELMPNPGVLDAASVEGLPLEAWLTELNHRVLRHAGRDARNLQIGHAYLMSGGEPLSDPARFAEVLRDDIVPLLQEYCYDDFQALEQILGSGLVDAERRVIDASLFEPRRRGDLFKALFAAFAEIMATVEAAKADTEAEESDLADELEDDGSGADE
ncbi:MAG: AAA family ATPase [Deltaproteobacteria bacterium]|nr:MAG: AAA family ATPase [Deltaproteobacteria bacterium]